MLLFVRVAERKFPNITAQALLRKGTKVLVPRYMEVDEVEREAATFRQSWHVCDEDSTLRKEAGKCGLDAQALLSLNKSKLRGLQLNSYLLKGTRLLTNGSDVDFAEYCHWTYPEDDASTCQTSYMMARPLKPHAERTGGPAPESIIERSRPLILSERPPVVPSEKRRHLVGRVAPPPAEGAGPPKLFNRVVRIEGEADYEYFYVLTYLPDLQWCHVGPLERRGVFGADETRGRPGRDRWMLVPEEMGGERDCGAARCTIMEATEVKQTKESADEEEWDVIGVAKAADPPPPSVAHIETSFNQPPVPAAAPPLPVAQAAEACSTGAAAVSAAAAAATAAAPGRPAAVPPSAPSPSTAAATPNDSPSPSAAPADGSAAAVAP